VDLHLHRVHFLVLVYFYTINIVINIVFDKCRICVVGIAAVQSHLYSVNCTGYHSKMRTGVVPGYCHYFSNMLELGHLQKMNAICVCTATLNHPWG